MRVESIAARIIVATAVAVLLVWPSARAQVRPFPTAVTGASAELVDRLRSDFFTYFRFVNRSWAARTCQALRDVQDPPVMRLHGDAHVEQYAFTDDAWGLTDFDDSVRGPGFVDIVRFLGSIDLATRQRGWTRDREALWDRFFAGYRAGLSNPRRQPREPVIVHYLRAQKQLTREGFLAVAESLMQPMEPATLNAVTTAMEAFERVVRRDRPSLRPGYFAIKHAGWLHIGVGSSAATKVLIRIQGPTMDDGDDVILEGKEVTNLDGVMCVEGPTTPPAVRVVDGARQLGRLKHDILAIGPTLVIPAAAGRAEQGLDWWISSWEPSYRELRVSDLRSVNDLSEIVYDSGIQLGANEPDDRSGRQRALASVVRLERRFRKETAVIVEEMLAAWTNMAARTR
jgi:hypothetical protein